MSRNDDLGWMAQLDVLRIEQHVSALRLGVFVILAALACGAGLEGSSPWPLVLVILVALVLSLVPTAVNFFAARKRQHKPTWWYVGHTVDALAITGVIAATTLLQSAAEGLLGATFLAYFFVIIGAGIRFHVRTALYATVLSAVAYSLVALWASFQPSLSTNSAALDNLARPLALALRPLAMGVAGLVIITLIRRAQKVTEVLQEADRKQARVIQHIRDGYLLCDADQRALEINAAASDMLALPRSNVLGLQVTVVMPAPLAALLRSRWQEILEEGTYFEQAIHFTTDHGDRCLDLSALRLPHPDKPLVQIVLHDVTAESQLGEQSAQYERLQALRSLTTGVAHEFNNIFATIEASSFILSEATSKQSPQYTEVVAIRNAATRAARFSRELLDMADMRPASTHLLDTSALLHKAAAAQECDNPAVKVLFDIAEDVRWIKGDEGQLERALGNLIACAYRAMLDGGTLTLAAHNLTLNTRDGQLPPGDYVNITIRDTGLGMPPEVVARAFDPLAQSDSLAPGVVGLANVQATLLRHHGSVQIESTVGQGTVFTLLLPASRELGEHPRGLPKRDAGERSRRLLVVDDEPANRTSLARLLTFRGYDVLLAEDGMTALRIAQEHGDQIDLVLLDLLMPEMNGKDVLTALRTLRPEIKVLLVTGYAEQVLVQEALELGASGVAYKPFDVPALLEQVQQLTQN